MAIPSAVVDVLEPGFVEQKGGYTQVYQTFSDQLRQTVIVTFVHHEPELVCQHQIHPEQHLEEAVVECGHCIQFPVLLLHKGFLYVFVGDVVHLEPFTHLGHTSTNTLRPDWLSALTVIPQRKEKPRISSRRIYLYLSAILTPLPRAVDDLRCPVTYLREERSRYLDHVVKGDDARVVVLGRPDELGVYAHVESRGDAEHGVRLAPYHPKSCLATLSSAAVLSSGPGENTHMLVIDEKYLLMTWLSAQGQETLANMDAEQSDVSASVVFEDNVME
uniref:Uncharacterized protein n=1 Tax=Timema douglasi TaxID=61478 RepID=A0A7R8VKT0_TIMDO|nr:unnamed protein product [Timema douglasi]